MKKNPRIAVRRSSRGWQEKYAVLAALATIRRRFLSPSCRRGDGSSSPRRLFLHRSDEMAVVGILYLTKRK
jgi:hypothetical protein